MSLLALTVQPTGTETHFRQLVVLDGARWQIDCYTNGADGCWYFDLAGELGETVRGVALANGVDLLAPYRHLGVPAGYLFVGDKGLGGADPRADDFAAGWAVLYYLEAE